MRVHPHRSQPKVSASTPATPSAPSSAPAQEPATDAYLDPAKREALMANALRAEQGGARPAPQMTAPASVRAFEGAARSSPAPGVELAVISRSKDDPSVTVSRTALTAGSKTPSERLDTDQRVLVEGSGTATLNGVAQPLVPGDMVLIPRGTKFDFSADGGGPLTLWTVGSGGDAPMQQRPGVLSEDPKKEFFVGEGVLILERANSALDPGVGFDRCRVPAGITTASHQLKIDERYLITRGGGVMDLGGVKVPVKAGDLVMIPKGVAQRISAAEGGIDFYSVTTPRFLVADYDRHLADATVDPKLYDGLAGPLEAVQAKIHQP